MGRSAEGRNARAGEVDGDARRAADHASIGQFRAVCGGDRDADLADDRPVIEDRRVTAHRDAEGRVGDWPNAGAHDLAAIDDVGRYVGADAHETARDRSGVRDIDVVGQHAIRIAIGAGAENIPGVDDSCGAGAAGYRVDGNDAANVAAVIQHQGRREDADRAPGYASAVVDRGRAVRHIDAEGVAEHFAGGQIEKRQVAVVENSEGSV